MLGVIIRERDRRFNVFVGEKFVGVLEGRKGYFRVYYSLDNESQYLCNEPSLRRAMQTLLQHEGYGKSSPRYKVKTLEVA